MVGEIVYGRVVVVAGRGSSRKRRRRLLFFGFLLYFFPPRFSSSDSLYRCGGRARLEGQTSTLSRVDSSHSAMYGRVNENLTQEVVESTTMCEGDVFSDLGCGIGQTCLQVSATTGCMSYGYEIVRERCDSAIRLLTELDVVLTEVRSILHSNFHFFSFFFVCFLPVILR